MSIGSPTFIPGKPVDKEVYRQFKKRQDILSNTGNRLNSDNNTIESYNFFNKKASFIKLTSSINIDGSSELARNNVLSLGNKKDTDTNIEGYHNSSTLGIRPNAGVYSLDMTTHNIYGSLRTTTVKFKVNSIEDLDVYEQLYMSPGYSALVEWGHTVVLDSNDGALSNIEETVDLFEAKNQQKVQENIERLKNKYNYNYDGVFGLTKNFSWSIEPDGTYDCSVDIVSKGYLMESVNIYAPILRKDIIAFLRDESIDKLTEGSKLEDKRAEGSLTGLNLIRYEKDALIVPENKSSESQSSINSLVEGLKNTLKNNEDVNLKSNDPYEDVTLKSNDPYYVEEEFILGKKTILEYLGYPLYKSTSEANDKILHILVGMKSDGESRILFAYPSTLSFVIATVREDKQNFDGIKVNNAINGESGTIKKVRDDIITYKSTYDSLISRETRSVTRYLGQYIIKLDDNNEQENVNSEEDKNLIDSNEGNLSDLLPTIKESYVELRSRINYLIYKSLDILDESTELQDKLTKSNYFYELNSEFTPNIASLSSTIENDSIYNAVAYKYMIIDDNGNGGKDNRPDKRYRYIQMGLLLDILNIFLPRDQNGNLIYSFDTSIEEPFKNVRDFRTLDRYHVSVDPSVCLLPHTHEDYKLEFNKIYGILIEETYLYNKINNYMSSGAIQSFDFIDSILGDIKRVTGGVNDFQLQYYEEGGKFRVIDRNFIDIQNKVPKISVFGLNTFVKEIDLSSQLSPKIGSQLAIAAQANKFSNAIDGSSWEHFNKNLKDRVIEDRRDITSLEFDDSEGSEALTTDELEDNFIEVMLYLYIVYPNMSLVQDDPIVKNLEYQGELPPNIIYQYKAFCENIKNEESVYKKNNFIIPYELGLTLDGISGFKIMETFKIDDEIIPSRYRSGGVGFIITGISQSVTSDGWSTKLTTQVYNLDEDKNVYSNSDKGQGWRIPRPYNEVESSNSNIRRPRKNVNSLSISDKGLDFIKKVEGLRLTAYEDADTISIGYGTSNKSGIVDLTVGETITEEKADRYFKKSLDQIYEPAVKRNVEVPLSQGEYDALVSFTYNLGESNLIEITPTLNSRDYEGTADLMLLYNKSEGEVSGGLSKRRFRERLMFLNS